MKKYIIIIVLAAFAACKKDSSSGGTLQSVGTNPASANPTNTGTGGSYARFAINDKFLYALSRDTLKVFEIDNGNDLHFTKKVTLQSRVETIFPYGDYLFFGTQAGMLIYSVKDKSNPSYLSTYTHIVSCDPVAVDGNYAYVTLHSGAVRGRTFCTRGTNQMDIIDISNPQSPIKVGSSIPLKQPLGIGALNKRVFFCDDDAVKMYDATNPTSLKPLDSYANSAFYDVIPLENTLLTIADDGFYQFDYKTNDRLTLLSKILVVK
ncbi:MAG: hypothetical protein NTX03_14360 [Bacteroidetes bacterium]|nr:hypothetical protein [Bacteroidota bacterium]